VRRNHIIKHIKTCIFKIESNELQTLCFFAGANSIFYGEELLTTPNPTPEKDLELLNDLGIRAEVVKQVLKH